MLGTDCASAGISSARWVIGSGRAEHLAEPRLAGSTATLISYASGVRPVSGSRIISNPFLLRFREKSMKDAVILAVALFLVFVPAVPAPVRVMELTSGGNCIAGRPCTNPTTLVQGYASPTYVVSGLGGAWYQGGWDFLSPWTSPWPTPWYA